MQGQGLSETNCRTLGFEFFEFEKEWGEIPGTDSVLYGDMGIDAAPTAGSILPVSGIIIPDMGTSRLARTRLADALFTPVQQRVLALLFGQPDRRFQSAELIRLVDSGTGAVHRQLRRLADAGLVTVTRVGNQKHYQAGHDSPVFSELHGLVVKTVGIVEPLRAALASLADRIEAAFVFGSLAKRTDRASSDVDLLVISADLAYPEIFEALQSAGQTLARSVNPTLMSPDQWRDKRARHDSFVARIADQPKLFVLGSEDALF